MADFGYIDRSLWAEDGTIFVNQAADLGVQSLWRSYAGYLLVYPRICALIANLLPLYLTPFVFFCAWLLPFFVLAWVVVDKASARGVDNKTTLLAIILISLQPTSGDVYFSITNAQWIMGAALIIHLLVPTTTTEPVLPRGRINRCKEPISITLASLTGPFSVLLLPALAVRLYLLRDFNKHKIVYASVFSCALLQLAILTTSDRIHSNRFDSQIHHWLDALRVFATFGSSNWWVIGLSLLFWIILTYAFLTNCRTNGCSLYAKGNSSTIMTSMALLIFIAGAYASKVTPNAIHPLGGGSRYYFIPYTLLILSSILVPTKQKLPRYTLLFCLILICCYSFSSINRTDLQYQAHVEFANAKPNLTIPINPVSPNYPGWHIKANKSESFHEETENKVIQPEVLDKANFVSNRASAYMQDGVLVVASHDDDPQLFPPATSICADSKYVGVEILVRRNQPGWAQLFWSGDDLFGRHKSLKRYFPAGEISMYFAFRHSARTLKLRFVPMSSPGRADIKHFHLYCLA